MLHSRRWLCVFVLVAGMSSHGCQQTSPEPAGKGDQASSSTSGQPAAAQPQGPNELTKSLFSHLIRSEVGQGEGVIDLRGTGILIHPGQTPTTATFQLTDNRKELRLKLYISPLDKEGMKVPEAGTVNAEVLVDGKPVFKSYVDRNSRIEIPVNVSGAKELTVRVDNADGKAWWDWFMISVSSAS